MDSSGLLSTNWESALNIETCRNPHHIANGYSKVKRSASSLSSDLSEGENDRVVSLPISTLKRGGLLKVDSGASDDINTDKNALSVNHTSPEDEKLSKLKELYLSEDLLHIADTKAKAELSDPKTFVDRALARDPEEVMKEFARLVDMGLLLDPIAMKTFVEENFQDSHSELIPEMPTDFVAHPQFIRQINDPSMALWTKQLNALWQSLYRRIDIRVKEESEKYSLLYLKNPVILPGGRFQELYYWDSWWIIKGLLACEMLDTAKGIVSNFCDLVLQFGFIPNGTRVYYLNRSQPPLLSEMVRSYLTKVLQSGETEENMKETIVSWTEALDIEYKFWMEKRLVTVTDNEQKEHSLNRYDADVNAPRPESYGADVEVFESVTKLAEEGLLPDAVSYNKGDQLFRNIAAACESGWDFSTRWCYDYRTLETIYTTKLLPVDLNCIMYRMELNLAYMHEKLDNELKANAYRTAAARRKEAITKLMWSAEKGQWFDYDIQHHKQREGTYASNWFPLWAGCFDSKNVEVLSASVIKGLKESGLVGNAGVQTSAVYSGLQWDAPNCWAPVQDFIILGLYELGTREAKAFSLDIAGRWVITNYLGWKRSNLFEMHEKYHAFKIGERGAGGEYQPQIGFGWTNGLVLFLLEKFGKDMKTSFLREKLSAMLAYAVIDESKNQIYNSLHKNIDGAFQKNEIPSHLRPLLNLPYFQIEACSDYGGIHIPH